MTHEHDETDPRFVERIALPLRAAERLDDGFEARVMSAAHAVPPRDGVMSLGWWRRSRTIALSPLGGLAMAAGLLAVTLLGATALAPVLRPSAAAPAVAMAGAANRGATSDTVHVVRFVLADARATSIALVGDFNDWSESATHLTRLPDGKAWIVSVILPPGRHEYAFLVRDDRGEHWVADPFATTMHDEFGTVSSLVQVGGGERRTTSSL